MEDGREEEKAWWAGQNVHTILSSIVALRGLARGIKITPPPASPGSSRRNCLDTVLFLPRLALACSDP